MSAKILNTALDCIITLDRKGCIQSFNPAAGKLFGYTEQEVLGKNISLLMPSPHQENHNNYLANFQKTGKMFSHYPIL